MCKCHNPNGDEADSPLNRELAQAAENPQEFDFSFAEQREETGYANFGYSPDKAAELREKEQARIAKEWELGEDAKRPYREPKDIWE